jgi:hypothetical protein
MKIEDGFDKVSKSALSVRKEQKGSSRITSQMSMSHNRERAGTSKLTNKTIRNEKFL